MTSFRLLRFLLVLAVLLPAASIAWSAADDTVEPAPNPWSELFIAPTEITTERVFLEPLTPDHTSLDYTAVISSSDHLRETLQWGDWPPADMSEDDNRAALENHWAEFENREAYAYTVLSTDKQSCLGCVYLSPASSSDNGLSMIFWVRADQLHTGLDIHVIETIVAHVSAAWPVEFIEFPIPIQNQRGIETLNEFGFEISAENPRQITFVWRR